MQKKAKSSRVVRRPAAAAGQVKASVSPWAAYARDGAKSAKAAERLSQRDLTIRINTRG
jgi:hypothetical protein